jgi:hypothetical protein
VDLHAAVSLSESWTIATLLPLQDHSSTVDECTHQCRPACFYFSASIDEMKVDHRRNEAVERLVVASIMRVAAAKKYFSNQ